ncbi:MAG TPA: hypothetical protein VLM85_22200 [Polyangiaceae bacterium]|nr:hypothetical protein [Polyangiaceae bacterium]
MRRFAFVVACLFPAVACFTGSGSNNTNPDASAGGVTFYKDVAPILQNTCQHCHVPGGVAPFPLVTYDDAKANAAGMVADTQARIMPPWGAQSTSECTPRFPWKNDIRLSDAQIATIKAWHDGGDVAGNPADAPPPSTTPPVTDLPNATSLTPAVPYTLTQTGDYFRCFVLDPNITATGTYLTGTFIKPGNTTIVHHALIFSAPASATIPPSTDGVPNQYDCFGDSGVSGAELVAAWAPGGTPQQYPAGVGHPLAAGSKFIMQIHYHPHSNATSTPDATTFQFATTTTKPAWTVGTALLGNYAKAVNNGTGLENPPFSIPPDTANQVFTMDSTAPAAIPITLRILSVLPHMHLVGSDIKVTVDRAAPDANNPASECLVQVPSWNFNWQRNYQYDVDVSSLPTIGPGDTIKVRCTYDNTTSNAPLMQALSEKGLTQTQIVTLGETTLDEMCLGGFWYVYPTP